MKRALVSMLTPIALAALVAGCGSSKESTSTAASTSQSTATATTNTAVPSPTSGSGSSSLSLAANPEGQLKYTTSSLTAKAGKVSIAFSNSSPLAHNMTIESSGGQILGATPTFQGGSKTLTLDLKPGTYKFFCSVPGHRMAGMEGTLVVK